LNRRVVITGVGLVSPLGIGVDETWQALCAGKSGVGEITRFDTSNFQTRIAAEVKNFNAKDFLPRKEAKRIEPFIAYAIAAARMAVEDSGLVIDSTNSDRVGVITGCGLGGLGILESTCSTLHRRGHGNRKVRSTRSRTGALNHELDAGRSRCTAGYAGVRGIWPGETSHRTRRAEPALHELWTHYLRYFWRGVSLHGSG